MSKLDESTKNTFGRQCKLFNLQKENTPDFCEKHFIPKVEWQKFCNNENKCHDEYWRLIYREKNTLHKRLERLEKLYSGKGLSPEEEAGISKQ